MALAFANRYVLRSFVHLSLGSLKRSPCDMLEVHADEQLVDSINTQNRIARICQTSMRLPNHSELISERLADAHSSRRQRTRRAKTSPS